MNNLALSRQQSQQQQHPYPLHHQNGGGSKKKKERPKSIGSALLTDAENEQLVSILGRDRISLCAGVAQLFAAYPESPNIWRKANVGIALLIKDYLNRNYALCIYDIFKAEPLWSQVLYKNFQAGYYSNCPRFITFEGDHCVFALSFTDFEEAQKFKEALERRRDHELKSSRAHQNHRGSLNNNNNHHPTQNQNMHSTAATKRVGPPPPPPPPIQMPPNNKIHQSPPQNGAIHTTGITNIGAVPHFGGNLQHLSSPKGKTKTSKNGKGNKGKERITKEDIGNPTNFIHKAHIGWDATSGVQIHNYGIPMDESIRELLRSIGKDPESMDPAEAEFTNNFVNEYKKGTPVGQFAIGTPQPQQLQQPMANGFNNSTMMQNEYPPPTPQRQPHQPAPPRPPPLTSSSAGHGQQQHTIMYYSETAYAMAQQQTSTHPPPPIPHPQPIGPPPPQRDTSLASNNHTNVVVMRQQAPPPPPPSMNKKPLPPPSIPPTMMMAPNQRKENSPPTEMSSMSTAVAATSSAPPPPPPPPPLPPPPPAQKKPSIDAGESAEPKQANSTTSANSGRANLLQEIQQGKTLRKVGMPSGERSPVPTNPPTMRDNMMEQIKQGTNLKHVDQAEIEQNRKSGGGLQDLGGIAGALARALEERRRNIVQSDDSSDSGSETNNDSEWEDSAQ